MACLMFAVSTTAYIRKTAEGTQCPTAPVQVIEVVRTVKTCCGDEIQVVEKRKPLPGEDAFRQCACAETKSAGSAASKRTGELPSFTLPEPPLVPACPIVVDSHRARRSAIPLPTGPASIPLTPPPVAA